jgi:ParB/Sulfiredoxin domain
LAFTWAFALLVWREEVRVVPGIQTIAIEQIYVPVKRRKDVKPELVRAIAESIMEVGQQIPIVVRPDKDRFVLLEGLQRLEACRALGETTIAARFGIAQPTHEQTVYEHNAEAQREKIERLRKLRLAQQGANLAKPADSSAQPIRPDLPSRKPAKTKPTSKPENLSEWLESQEHSGNRY